MRLETSMPSSLQIQARRTTLWLHLRLPMQSRLLRLESVRSTTWFLRKKIPTTKKSIAINFEIREKNFHTYSTFESHTNNTFRSKINEIKMSCRRSASMPCIPSSPASVPVPQSGCNPYAICVPLYPCAGNCVPIYVCSSWCQPFATPGSKHTSRCDNEATRNKKYPEVCVPQCLSRPVTRRCWFTWFGAHEKIFEKWINFCLNIQRTFFCSCQFIASVYSFEDLNIAWRENNFCFLENFISRKIEHSKSFSSGW